MGNGLVHAGRWNRLLSLTECRNFKCAKENSPPSSDGRAVFQFRSRGDRTAIELFCRNLRDLWPSVRQLLRVSEPSNFGRFQEVRLSPVPDS